MESAECHKCGALDDATNMPAIIFSDRKLYQCNNRKDCLARVQNKKYEIDQCAIALNKAKEAELFKKFGDDILNNSRLFPLPRIRDAREHYYDIITGNILSCHINAPKYELDIPKDADKLKSFYDTYIKHLVACTLNLEVANTLKNNV